jgi:hypothetical protein
MVRYDVQKDDKSVFKNNHDVWGVSYLWKRVICQKEPPSSFSCKIDILRVDPFLQNKGDISSCSGA